MDDEKQPRVVLLAERFEAWCARQEHRFAGWLGHWDQLDRATASLVSNIGEALDSRTPGQKRQYFGFALGSAGEARKLVRGAASAGILPDPEVDEGLRLLKDIRWDLIRLIEWTKR